MASCLLKAELKTIEDIMYTLQQNVDFFWGRLNMHLVYLEVKYDEQMKLYKVECCFCS